MKKLLSIAALASTVGLAFAGAAATTRHTSADRMTAQQPSYLPVPLCPPDAPTCAPGGPPSVASK